MIISSPGATRRGAAGGRSRARLALALVTSAALLTTATALPALAVVVAQHPAAGQLSSQAVDSSSGLVDLAIDARSHVVYSTTGGALRAASPLWDSAPVGASLQHAQTAPASYDVLAVDPRAARVFAADTSASSLQQYAAVPVEVSADDLTAFAAQTPTTVALPAGVRGTVGGMVVDEGSGRLWASFPGDQEVAAYDPVARTWSAPVAVGQLVGPMTVDPDDHVLYATTTAGTVIAVGQGSTAVDRTAGPFVHSPVLAGITFDQANRLVLVADATEQLVGAFDTALTYRGSWDAGAAGAGDPSGLAVDSVHQQLYVTYSDAAHRDVVSSIDTAGGDPTRYSERRVVGGGRPGWGSTSTTIGVDVHLGYAAVPSTGSTLVVLDGVVDAAGDHARDGSAALKTTSLPDGHGADPYGARAVQSLSFVTRMDDPAGGTSDLPPGYAVDAAGFVHGSATEGGVYAVRFASTYLFHDGSSLRGTTGRALSGPAVPLTVVPAPPVVTTTSLTGLTAGTAVRQRLRATWMDGSHYPSAWALPTWAVTAGALPAGLVLDAATGLVTGTPTTAGTTTATVTATNPTGTGAVVLTLAVAPAAAAAGTPADAAPTAGGPGVVRVGGPVRTATATALSQHLWPAGGPTAPSVPAVVIAGSSAVDAPAGAPLAHAVGGPLLLTDPSGLTEDTAAEVRRLLRDGGTAYLLGGTSAVGEHVAAQLAAMPGRPEVVRLPGEDRFATSVSVARELHLLDRDDGPVYLAAGIDAPLAAPLAARTGGTVLLVRDGDLPAAVSAHLLQQDPGARRTVPVGQPAARAVPGAAARVIAGADRYETASLVAAAFTAGGSAPTVLGLASGTSPGDARTAAAAVALLDAPLLLTEPDRLSPRARAVIDATPTARALLVVGGDTAVSADVLAALRALRP